MVLLVIPRYLLMMSTGTNGARSYQSISRPSVQLASSFSAVKSKTSIFMAGIAFALLPNPQGLNQMVPWFMLKYSHT